MLLYSNFGLFSESELQRSLKRKKDKGVILWLKSIWRFEKLILVRNKEGELQVAFLFNTCTIGGEDVVGDGACSR